MSQSLFDIFGDHLNTKTAKNVSKQPFCNIENMGKMVSSGPIKPNEPIKKVGEIKKSFFSNTGKGLQSTPLRQTFSPKPINVGAFIYTEYPKANNKGFSTAELEFTKNSFKYDNYHRDAIDFFPIPEIPITKQISPPNTPPPLTRRYSIELDCSYEDEFFTDDFSCESIQDDELDLPKLY